jgi:hypothetical protein
MKTDSPKKIPFENFLDMHLQELLAMSDEEILEGADPAAVKAEGLRVLDAAKTEAGKRRLTVARARMEAERAASPSSEESVAAADARAYLQKVSNDPRFTLAARELGELSDDDAIRLYKQFRSLESHSGDDSDGSA